MMLKNKMLLLHFDKGIRFLGSIIFMMLFAGCSRHASLVNSRADEKFTKFFNVTVVDSLGLTLKKGAFGNIINGQSFQQDALISHKGWQYVAYYNSARNVCVGRRKLPHGSWEVAQLTDYHFSYTPARNNDAHNTISMGLCKKDGTIHLSFDHHVSDLHYRISKKNILDNPQSIPWTAALFKPVQNYLEEGKPLTSVTYPCFVSTPQGDLLLGYRIGNSRNAGYFVGLYNGQTGKWENIHQIVSGKGEYADPYKGISKSRNAYHNGLHYGRDGKLHMSWVWREGVSGVGNRDISYAYSPDNGNTWFNSFDQVVATLDGSKLIDTYSKDIAVKVLDRHWGTMNSQAQAVDQNGVPHAVMYHRKTTGTTEDWARITNEAVYYHYYRKADGTWGENQTPFIGNRPKLLADRKNNLYLIYIRKDGLDSKDSAAPLVVIKATSAKNWADWQEILVSEERYFNEVQVDLPRWEEEGILSVMVQDKPVSEGASSAVKVVDIKF